MSFPRLWGEKSTLIDGMLQRWSVQMSKAIGDLCFGVLGGRIRFLWMRSACKTFPKDNASSNAWTGVFVVCLCAQLWYALPSPRVGIAIVGLPLGVISACMCGVINGGSCYT